MKHSPEELEKLVHQTLRGLPNRPAPRSLEARVLAAIEAKTSLPWYRQSYAQWPLAARCMFLLVSGGLVKVALMAAVWAMAGFDGGDLNRAFSTQFAWIDAMNSALRGSGEFCAIVFRGIPPLWLYGGLAALAALYAMLFGLGATAYRTLYADR